MKKKSKQRKELKIRPGRGRGILESLFQLRRIGKFLIVGTLGFLTDTGCFMAFSHWGIPIYPARLASFSVAVSVTWLFNSRWTFRMDQSKSVQKTIFKYLGSQSIGSLVNLGVFFVGVNINETLRTYPPITIGIASICAMAFNYIACHWFVFGERKESPQGNVNPDGPHRGQKKISVDRRSPQRRKKQSG